MPVRLWLALGGLVAVMLIATWAITTAYQAGQEAERTAALQRAIKAYQSREVIDNEVGRADLIDICVSIGGVRDQCADELRRMEETAGSE